jgi:hypothetical protein
LENDRRTSLGGPRPDGCRAARWEREREIEAFVKTEYWSIIANLSLHLPPNFDANFTESRKDR